jgi:hypothetical protein
VVHFALEELLRETRDGRREEILARLREHLRQIKERRSQSTQAES